MLAVTLLAAGLVAHAFAAHRRASAPHLFVGAVVYPDDHLQYLSFAEQAQRGAFLLRNKFDPDPRPRPVLVNLTWWLTGTIARLTGWSLGGAFALVGLGATLLASAAVGLLMNLAGRPPTAAAWGVLLVATGSGTGWIVRALGHPVGIPPDAGLLLYPWAQFLLAPHAAVGTGLLLAALAARVAHERGACGPAPWLVLGTLLGLTRPFDLGVLAGAVLVSLAWQRAPWEAFRPLLGLVPVLAYDAWIYGFHPSLGAYGSAQNVIRGPGLLAWALALALPAVLAAWALRAPAPDTGMAAARRVLGSALASCALLVASPLGFALQFSTSLGALVLALAAIALPARVVPIAALACLPGSLLLADAARHTPPGAVVPGDYARATDFLAVACRPGDVVVGPIDPSLQVAARTPCHVLLGHRVLTPRYETRLEDVRRLYASTTGAAERVTWLRTVAPRFVLVPPGRGEALLEGTGYRAVLRLPALEIWSADPG